MNIYIISQDENNGYDTYDAAVVFANTEEEAMSMHPGGVIDWESYGSPTWCGADKVKVKFVGVAAEGTLRGVLLASFNAG